MTLYKSFFYVMRLSILTCMVVFFVLLTFGYSKKEEPVVARVGKGSITVADFKSYLSDRSMPRRDRVSKEDLKKLLDEMVLEEVLYQETLRLKLDQDQSVRRSIRQMLTQELMEKVEREVWSREIEKKELQEYYDRHRDEFNRPEQVRLADIFISVPADATDKKRIELKKKAKTVLVEALKVRGKRSGFGPLVSKYSDRNEKYRKGDTGFFDIEGKPAGIDKKLTEAAFKLERVGSMPGHVIATPDGYHVVMLIGKRSATHRPLDKVRNQLKQRIRREAVAKARQTYIEGLKEKAKIRIDTQIMSGILEELKNTERTRQPSSTNISPPPMHGGGRTPPSLPRRE